MKCPNCNHVSDTTPLKCSACGQTYDPAALETLQHLEYLLNWLDNREEEFGPRLFARLRGEVVERLDALRTEIQLPPLAAAPAAPPTVPVTPTPAPAALFVFGSFVVYFLFDYYVFTLIVIVGWYLANWLGLRQANRGRCWLWQCPAAAAPVGRARGPSRRPAGRNGDSRAAHACRPARGVRPGAGACARQQPRGGHRQFSVRLPLRPAGTPPPRRSGARKAGRGRDVLIRHIGGFWQLLCWYWQLRRPMLRVDANTVLWRLL